MWSYFNMKFNIYHTNKKVDMKQELQSTLPEPGMKQVACILPMKSSKPIIA